MKISTFEFKNGNITINSMNGERDEFDKIKCYLEDKSKDFLFHVHIPPIELIESRMRQYGYFIEITSSQMDEKWSTIICYVGVFVSYEDKSEEDIKMLINLEVPSEISKLKIMGEALKELDKNPDRKNKSTLERVLSPYLERVRKIEDEKNNKNIN